MLDFGEADAVVLGIASVDVDVDVAAAGGAVGEYGPSTFQSTENTLDVEPDAFDDCVVGTRNLDPDRRVDAGGLHVDAGTNRHQPGVVQTGDTHRSVQLTLDLFHRSEERRVGKEWVSTFRSRWSPCH